MSRARSCSICSRVAARNHLAASSMESGTPSTRRILPAVAWSAVVKPGALARAEEPAPRRSDRRSATAPGGGQKSLQARRPIRTGADAPPRGDQHLTPEATARIETRTGAAPTTCSKSPSNNKCPRRPDARRATPGVPLRSEGNSQSRCQPGYHQGRGVPAGLLESRPGKPYRTAAMVGRPHARQLRANTVFPIPPWSDDRLIRQDGSSSRLWIRTILSPTSEVKALRRTGPGATPKSPRR